MGQAANEMTRGSGDYDPADMESALSDVGTDQSFGAVTGGSDTENEGATPEDPAEIRANIEQTRSEMSQTIDAIQEKISPSNIAEQAKDALHEATVGRAQEAVSNASQAAKGFGEEMLETIKQNPLPAALAGIGIGWLFMKSNQKSGGRNRHYESYRYGYEPRYSREYGGWRGEADYRQQSQGGPGEVVGQVREKAGDTLQSAGDTVGEAARKVGDTVGQAAGTAGDKVGQLGDQVQYRAEQTTDWFQRTLQENPMAVGVAAVAAGALAGLLLPETRQEHQIMGQARDQLVDRAGSAVQDTMEKVQRVAEETTNTVQREAQNQGLTGGQPNQGANA